VQPEVECKLAGDATGIGRRDVSQGTRARPSLAGISGARRPRFLPLAMAAPNQYPYSRSSRTPAPQPPISYGASAYAVPQLPPRRGSGAMPAPGISFAAHHGALAEEDDVLRPLPPRRVATGFAIPRSTTAPPSSSAVGPLRVNAVFSSTNKSYSSRPRRVGFSTHHHHRRRLFNSRFITVHDLIATSRSQH